MNILKSTYAVLLVGACAWCMAIVAAPLLAENFAGYTLYQAFHQICHQLPERSFHLAGESFGVCARCTSIYFAFLIGIVAYPFFKSLDDVRIPSRALLVAAMLPMLIDVGLGVLDIHESSLATRVFTGAIFGLVLPFIILPVALEAVQQLVKPPTIVQHSKGSPHA